MKTRTNKQKRSSDSNDTPAKNVENNPDYTVREISNGWIVLKTWSDKDGKYHREEVYHKDNPIDEESLLDTGESKEDKD